MSRIPVICILVLFLIVWSIAGVSFFYDTFEVRERHAGLIANQLITGTLLMPLINYQYHAEKGDALVTGVLAAPFFFLFGDTYFSLKLTGLMLGLLTLLLWFIYVRGFFGRREAVIFALLFIFCPATLTKVSLITWGSHGQANFYIIAALSLFSFILFKKRKNKENYLFFFSGLACGLALYAVKIFGIFLAAAIISWLFIDKKMFLRIKAYIFISGLLIGYSPGIYYSKLHASPFLEANMKSVFSYFSPDKIAAKASGLLHLIFRDLPGSFMFFNSPGNVFNYAYFLVFVICLVLAARENFRAKGCQGVPEKRKILGFSFVYFILFFLVLNFSDFKLEPWDGWRGYRYLVVIYPFIFLIMAYGLGAAVKKINNKAFGWLALLAFISLAALGGNLQSTEFDRIANILSYRGATYSRVGWFIAKAYMSQDEKTALSIMNRIPEKDRHAAYEGFGFQACMSGKPGILKAVPAEYKKSAYKGFGSMSLWSEVRMNDIEEGVYKKKDTAFWQELKAGKLRNFSSVINIVPEEYREDYLTGVAKAYAVDSDFDFERGEKFFALFFSGPQMKYFYLGFGEALGEKYGRDKIAYGYLKNAPGEAGQRLKTGLEYGQKLSLSF